MDLATLLGIIIGFVMVVIGIITSTTNPTLKGIMDTFVDIPSIAVTIGGSMAGMLTSYTFKTFLGHLKGFGIAMKDPKLDNGQVISKIIELSNTARKEGLLALDGTEPELVRGILETELVNLDTRHKSTIGFFDNWAALAPAWGMIGTLLGLVNMLKNLSDTASIGPNMAVALLTTLYGSLIANWICVPISNKLKLQNNDEYQLREIIIEGLLSIQAGENPRVIEEKLKSFLSPSARTALSEQGGGEG